MKIEITIGEHSLYRNYGLEDGQVPENIKEDIQDIVATLLDNQEDPFADEKAKDEFYNR